MPYPKLPEPEPGEVLLICACYEEGRAQWDGVLRALGGRRDGQVVALGDGGVRLRLAEHPEWDYVHGGNFPALVEEGGAAPPVAVVVDIRAVYGGDAVLLVDLRDIPGRGARVPTDGLGPVLADLLVGSLRFDGLVRGMDRFGIYQGDGGTPAVLTPTTVVRASFPPLPATETTLLVRTDFTDDRGWRALVDALGKPDEGSGGPTGEEFYEDVELSALVVDDRRFEHLQPGQIPAVVPPDEHTTMVALADAVTLADPAHPLFVVDLYDTPGQAARIPLAEAASMAVNLEIANMDFADFV
ncbi:DUF6924 domain-containing protein [Streptomyces sp. ME19-01-6]|uniref:DUF6924 domain-containing protein n=1 Tax=Streptomyces sp. ME19-01-6 TaxID=3028686 RepID=UPI0029BDBBFE|nr:hypothetical protein [Streptomyces sp. ME19-01-6]MDX3225971.1 hypothetical protein [Streptomyces sp. ME19-01-6]